MWKDFFYFTKTQRQGIIVLVVFIIGVYTVPYILEIFAQHKTINAAEQKKLIKEYAEFTSSIRQAETNRTYPYRYSATTYPKRAIKLAIFNPNTADSITFLSLGLPPWMAKNILRYRRKQGQFRTAEDFRKIYGLTEEQYQTLLPYIQIPKETILKDTTRLFTSQSTTKRDTLIKYQLGTIVSLNQADTTELKKIPGIGSGIAKMIVRRRNELGGFYKIEQLKEIRLRVERLRQWFAIDPRLIHRININKASIERIMHHPYINYYQAKVIVEYRKKKGMIKDLRQLVLYDEFSKEDFERITPYICYE